MYNIEKEDFFGTEKIKLVNQQSGEYVSVLPTFGGNLNELVLSKNGQLHELIAGDTSIETLSGKNANYYRGAKLSPFPNRINQGKYVFNSIEYQLKKNNPPHALHGLIWNIPLAIKKQSVSDTFASLVLNGSYQSFHQGYPFNYEIEIEYRLEANNFKCYTRILNTSGPPIPIGDGWHPYFTTGSTINSLKLQLPASRHIEMNEKLIPTGNYLPDSPFAVPAKLNDILLDDCFELAEKGTIAETRIMDEHKNITIVVWQKAGNRGYNFIQVYIPPDRNSIAVEPMSCAPDAFNNKNGLIILSPKETIEFCFGVRLE